jgi:hypothetical protein
LLIRALMVDEFNHSRVKEAARKALLLQQHPLHGFLAGAVLASDAMATEQREAAVSYLTQLPDLHAIAPRVSLGELRLVLRLSKLLKARRAQEKLVQSPAPRLVNRAADRAGKDRV